MILFKKLLRTAAKYRAQFISMIVMVAIGVGVFLGFNIEWYSLKIDTNKFLAETGYADYRIYSESGFSSDDLAKIADIDGVEKAARFFAADVSVKGTDATLSLAVTENAEVSGVYLTGGAAYDGGEGVWLSDKFAAKNGFAVNDEITLSYGARIEAVLKIVGLVKSGEYMVCVSSDNQVMPDYSTYGFAYVSPATMSNLLGLNGFELYTQINVVGGGENFEEKVNEALGATTLVLSKEEHISYAAAQSETQEGQTMGSVLPVLFLLIAILTMTTTMHRITANEKVQTGTMKALGFRDSAILRHYSAFGVVIGLVGAALGIALGYGIAFLIVNPVTFQGTYFDMAYWNLKTPWYCWLAVVLMVVLLAFIALLSVKKTVSGTAAEALRPYSPKKMKRTVLKGKSMEKLPFSLKWNLRDIFRHKSRSLMTLIGVVGCMILIVGALGMSDTMTAFIEDIDKSQNYVTSVGISRSATYEEAVEFAQSVEGDWVSSTSVRYQGKAVALNIYSLEREKIIFTDQKNNRVTVGDDGVYLCTRLAEGVAVGDEITFSPYGEDVVYTLRVAGVIRSAVTESIVMSYACAKQAGIPVSVTTVYSDYSASQIEELDTGNITESPQTKQAILDSYDSFMEIMDMMVIVLIVAAIILGAVVLYNLGVMSYTERYRELATLKVVGFRSGQIAGLLIGQNILLTIIGVIIGLPSGVGVLYLLIKLLATEYEMRVALGALTYCVSVLLTVGVSLIVGFLIARRNTKINMVEALKGAE